MMAETAARNDVDLYGEYEGAIHRLITELVILERAGVETLTFQLNGTFLDSVAEAVRVERTMRGI